VVGGDLLDRLAATACAAFLAGRDVVLTPVARIGNERLWTGTGVGDRALQHGFEMLDVGRLVADAHRHDHLVIAIDGRLAVVTLQQVPVTLHDVAVGISEIPLRTGLGAAIGPMGKPSMGHGIGCLGLQSLGLKACLTGLLDRQISGGLCFLP